MTLLIVDDDPRIRELTELAAHREGCFAVVLTAEHGANALERLQAGATPVPDVVLTDLSMPLLDGLDFVRTLRADPRWEGLPIVMFSSSNQPNDREQAIAAGCTAFYEKPASLAGLQSIIAHTFTLAASARRV
jgi:CheY-like chemotaxis protein